MHERPQHFWNQKIIENILGYMNPIFVLFCIHWTWWMTDTPILFQTTIIYALGLGLGEYVHRYVWLKIWLLFLNIWKLTNVHATIEITNKKRTYRYESIYRAIMARFNEPSTKESKGRRLCPQWPVHLKNY